MMFYYSGDSMENVIISKDANLCAEIAKYARIKNKTVYQAECEDVSVDDTNRLKLYGYKVIDPQYQAYLELVSINTSKCSTNVYDIERYNVQACEGLQKKEVPLLDLIKPKIGWRINGSVFDETLTMLGCVLDDFDPHLFGNAEEVDFDGCKYRVYSGKDKIEDLVVYTISGDTALRVAEKYEETVMAPGYIEVLDSDADDPEERRKIYEFLTSPHTYKIKTNNWKKF